MIEYNPKLPLYSIHIPKCAGTSFDKVLKLWFRLGYFRHYKDHVKNVMPLKRDFRKYYYKFVSPICVHGHFNSLLPEGRLFEYFPDAKQFITVIREPVKAHLSMYFYQKQLNANGGSYWNGNRKSNFACDNVDYWLTEKKFYLLDFFPWKLVEDNYKDIIEEKYVFIGVSEYLQDSIKVLANKLSFKEYKVPHDNVSYYNENPKEESIQIFKERHRLEYLVYDYIVNTYFR